MLSLLHIVCVYVTFVEIEKKTFYTQKQCVQMFGLQLCHDDDAHTIGFVSV